MPKVLLMQGANMEWLGSRQPELYGTTSAAELDDLVRARAIERGVELEIVYTNVEGEAISHIYRAVRDGFDGLLMNPAGFTYEGAALRDCLYGVGDALPYVEVHMTNIERRGTVSVTAPAADGVIAGLGIHSYLIGLDALLGLIDRRTTKAAVST